MSLVKTNLMLKALNGNSLRNVMMLEHPAKQRRRRSQVSSCGNVYVELCRTGIQIGNLGNVRKLTEQLAKQLLLRIIEKRESLTTRLWLGKRYAYDFHVRSAPERKADR